MELKSIEEDNVISRLAAKVALPRMVKVRQLMDHSHIQAEEIAEKVKEEMRRDEFRERIKQGQSIAITCGSRGVANIAIIIRAIVEFVKEQGAKPFVFPAMGSHGGASAEGQREILYGYGVTEEYIGCPIKASMEVDVVGETEEGMKVYVDHFANSADGIILCGRIKAHTGFRGPYESGLMKMAVIGMGKQKGAETVHRDGFSDLGRLLPMIGRVVLESVPVLGGIGVIENAFDETCGIYALTKEEIYTEEPEILALSKKRLGRIMFDDIDVLVVNKIGKDISGDGMDPNVTGRYQVPHMVSDKRVQHIAVLDLTDETHGNCNGIGMADVTTRRLVEKADMDATYPNVVTSTVLCAPKIPLFTHTDKECIQIALRTCNYIDRERPRIVWIQDTMHLEELYISEAMLEEAEKMEQIEIINGPEDWPFNGQGNLW